MFMTRPSQFRNNKSDIMTSNYIPPQFGLNGFNCPHCGFYAQQKWYDSISLSKFMGYATPGSKQLHEGSYQYYPGQIENISFSICSKCEEDGKSEKYAIWINEKMVYPNFSIAPLPAEDMPQDVKNDFLEAREIANKSPRAAAALLRLALEKLVTDHLEAEGSNINQRIGDLVERGLSSQIQKALDSVRVIGNEAVHPGQMNLKDDSETAVALFKLLNFIVEKTITESKEIDQIYNILPENKKEGIINRDKAK